MGACGAGAPSTGGVLLSLLFVASFAFSLDEGPKPTGSPTEDLCRRVTTERKEEEEEEEDGRRPNPDSRGYTRLLADVQDVKDDDIDDLKGRAWCVVFIIAITAMNTAGRMKERGMKEKEKGPTNGRGEEGALTLTQNPNPKPYRNPLLTVGW